MSLINEALKKAQGDRPQASPSPQGGNPLQGPGPVQVQKNKPKGFLWGFLLAVAVVGTVSSLLAAYLVLQLTDPKPEPSKQAPAIVEKAAQTPPESDTAAGELISDPVVETVVGSAFVTNHETTNPIPAEEKAESDPRSPATETAVPPTEAAGESAGQTALPSPPPAAPKSAPTPEVVERLRQLEIRGVMSGSTKVLIHDASTGKTKAYREGESLEGALGLVIVKITSNIIEFKDYAGQTHSKSF